MLSEALDITIESRGNTIWFFLSGPFNGEQVANIRSKIEDLVRDGNRQFIIDLEDISLIHESVAPMFLNLLNRIKGKDGDIKLIFRNEHVTKAFAPYRNIFPIFPDAKSITSKKILENIRKSGFFLARRTGLRVSVPVAIFLLFILTGWFVSLGIIINMQKKQIIVQKEKMQSIQNWKKAAEIEINDLKKRIKPIEQLGLIQDSPKD